jgi:hypothetical protein
VVPFLVGTSIAVVVWGAWWVATDAKAWFLEVYWLDVVSIAVACVGAHGLLFVIGAVAGGGLSRSSRPSVWLSLLAGLVVRLVGGVEMISGVAPIPALGIWWALPVGLAIGVASHRSARAKAVG